MPIEVGLWRLGEELERIDFLSIETEKKLEDILAKDISILGQNLLLIGRQVSTAFGKFIDLLAMDADGNLIVIELKRNRTPREVVAQLLDYGSWVRNLEDEDIAGIFDDYLKKYDPDRTVASLDQVFCKKFNIKRMPETLNESHELVVVASELDDSTERIINYLAEEYGVAINAIFFRFFKDGENEYLSRAWLIDPVEAEAKVIVKREKIPWNGEFYVSFGIYEDQRWEDAVKYGFISASGGVWYTRTLEMLELDDQVWVNVPGQGYVGVGKVTGTVVTADKFTIKQEDGTSIAIKNMSVEAPRMFNGIGDPEKVLHMVPVQWIKTVPLAEAIREKGFFGNQNTVAKPKSKKWLYTIERLKKRFEINE